MSNKQETIADIIAEKRNRANEIERDVAAKMANGEMVSDQYAREVITGLRKEADRIEAAAKREEEQAVQPQTNWNLKDAFAFANTLANHGWTRDANADAASSCIYALCRMLKDGGNAAAMREALKTLLNLAYEVQDANSEYGPKTSVPTQFIIDVAMAAIAAPPRNYDRFKTRKEARNYFDDFVCLRSNGSGAIDCKGCPLDSIDSPHRADCREAWLFAEAKEGDEK